MFTRRLLGLAMIISAGSSIPICTILPLQRMLVRLFHCSEPPVAW